MQASTENGVFADEEYFLVLRIEDAVDNSVSEGFDILLFFVFQQSLINDFLRHLFCMNYVATDGRLL